MRFRQDYKQDTGDFPRMFPKFDAGEREVLIGVIGLPSLVLQRVPYTHVRFSFENPFCLFVVVDLVADAR